MTNQSNFTADDPQQDYDVDMEMVPDATLINRAMFISGVIMLISCLVGFYGNLMSIAIFCHSSMRAPINVILTALSIIDTALISLSIPVFIMPSLNAVYQSEIVQRMYEWASLYLYPFSMMAHTCSIWTFVLVSVERYIAVHTPLKRHKLLTCGKAKLVQSAIVFSAIFYNFIRFWEYERASDSMLIRPLLRENHAYFLYYYVLLYMITHFLAPFAVILVLNMFVVCSLRAVNKDKLRRISRSEKQQRKTTQMIVVITLIFACFTTPPFVLNWIEVLNPQVFAGPYATLAFIAMDISNVLVVLNSSSTFIIYLIYCRKYRHLFMYYSSKCYSRGTTLRKWSEDRLSRRSTAISLTPAADELSGHSFTPERRHRLSYV